jgi:hypothetical protein
VSRNITKAYTPVLLWILRHKKVYLVVPVAILFLDHHLARHRQDAGSGRMDHQSVRPRESFSRAESGVALEGR